MVRFGEWNGLLRATALEPFMRLDVVGQCVFELKEQLIETANEYNLRFPKYIHWVIANPRGAEKYGFYLVRERR